MKELVMTSVEQTLLPPTASSLQDQGFNEVFHQIPKFFGSLLLKKILHVLLMSFSFLIHAFPLFTKPFFPSGSG
jgi:hypothetical protein